MDNNSPEKRQQPRVSLEVQVRVIPSKADYKVFGRIIDLSHDGFKLRAEFPSSFKGSFHKGDEVLFETSEEFYDIKGSGRIMWISDEKDMIGIKFDNLDGQSKKSLEEFLRMCF